jgi:hypothetical protein
MVEKYRPPSPERETMSAIKERLPLLWNHPSAGSEMNPLIKDQGYDNMLLVQGYRTPRGEVIDEYGAMVEWWLAGETKELKENPAPVPLCPPWISLEVAQD